MATSPAAICFAPPISTCGVLALLLVGIAAYALTQGGGELAKGDALLMIAMALLVLTNVAHLAFNPAMRPKKRGPIAGSIEEGVDRGKLTWVLFARC